MTPRIPATWLRQAGLSLIELMVALAIGIFLIAGAIALFGKTRDLYRANEAAARLQETARYAMSVIEGDLRMANYWGYSNTPDLITGALRQDDLVSPLSTELTGINPDQCGNNWVIDMATYVDGSNNEYTLTCAANSAVNGDADVLVVRRAGTTPIPDDDLDEPEFAGQLKIRTGRVQSELFFDDTPPALGIDNRPVIVHAYYVVSDPNADPFVGVPALRRKQLGFTIAGPQVEDVEITTGIEDLQFQVGVDTNGDQNADYYVDINDVDLTDTPVAVRVWLLVRADRPEIGFTDSRTYEYGDRTGADAYEPNDGFRRVLISRTIQLRNSRR
jgi:type IV pilus assembly protein PilW